MPRLRPDTTSGLDLCYALVDTSYSAPPVLEIAGRGPSVYTAPSYGGYGGSNGGNGLVSRGGSLQGQIPVQQMPQQPIQQSLRLGIPFSFEYSGYKPLSPLSSVSNDILTRINLLSSSELSQTHTFVTQQQPYQSYPLQQQQPYYQPAPTYPVKQPSYQKPAPPAVTAISGYRGTYNNYGPPIQYYHGDGYGYADATYEFSYLPKYDYYQPPTYTPPPQPTYSQPQSAYGSNGGYSSGSYNSGVPQSGAQPIIAEASDVADVYWAQERLHQLDRQRVVNDAAGVGQGLPQTRLMGQGIGVRRFSLDTPAPATHPQLFLSGHGTNTLAVSYGGAPAMSYGKGLSSSKGMQSSQQMQQLQGSTYIGDKPSTYTGSSNTGMHYGYNNAYSGANSNYNGYSGSNSYSGGYNTPQYTTVRPIEEFRIPFNTGGVMVGRNGLGGRDAGGSNNWGIRSEFNDGNSWGWGIN